MKATDLVCGMNLDPASPQYTRGEHDGVTYGFCSERCRELFMADPERVLAWAPALTPPGGRLLYTCLMHPGVLRASPSCPICSLALEPREAHSAR